MTTEQTLKAELSNLLRNCGGYRKVIRDLAEQALADSVDPEKIAENQFSLDCLADKLRSSANYARAWRL